MDKLIGLGMGIPYPWPSLIHVNGPLKTKTEAEKYKRRRVLLYFSLFWQLEVLMEDWNDHVRLTILDLPTRILFGHNIWRRERPWKTNSPNFFAESFCSFTVLHIAC